MIGVAFASRDLLGENPIWDVESQSLWWIDIRASQLHRAHAPTGERQSWPLPEVAGAIAFTTDRQILIAMPLGIAALAPATGVMSSIFENGSADPDYRFNDGRCDPWGNFWVGWMDQRSFSTRGAIYRLSKDRMLERKLGGIAIPNSICWSPDGTEMYLSDSRAAQIWSCAVDESGALGDQRVFARIEPPGVPDGAIVDSEGNLWCAIYGASSVVCYAPDGSIKNTIELPVTQPTSCCLGGADLRTLFITTARQRLTDAQLEAQPWAGSVLSYHVDVAGLPESRYGG